MRLHQLIAIFAHICAANVSGQTLEFFVSNDGSDSWDGTSETNVDGSDVGPWKTLHHAVEEIRQMRPNPPTSADDHVILSVLPGKHVLPSELDLNERDSHLTIRALYDEETAISGAMYLNGDWTQGPDSIEKKLADVLA